MAPPLSNPDGILHPGGCRPGSSVRLPVM